MRWQAVLPVLVPRYRGLSADEQSRALQIIEDFLRSRPAVLRFRLNLFFVLIDLLSVLRTGRLFRFAHPSGQEKVLRSFYDSPIPLLRKGFWGVNTLAKMGVFGQTTVQVSIGYELKTAA
jgi:hypothetical protein